jgi:hypothetical protein
MAIERDVLADGIESQSVIEDLDERVVEAVGDNYYTKDETEELIDNEIKDVYPLGEASGAIASFNAGVIMPLKSLTAEIKAIETGSGEKSPDNPYIISGFDNGIITRCGKNLLDDSKYYQQNANIVIVGQTETYANRRVYLPKGTYTIKAETSNTATIYYDFGSGSVSLGDTSKSRTFTLENNSYCAFWLYKSGGFAPSDIISIQLEVGETATTYKAYNGNNYEFAFGQTVYGGHFDNKGNLVVTHSIVDLSSLGWVYQSGNTRFYADSPSDLKRPTSNNEVINGVCSHYTIASYQTYTDKQLSVSVSGSVFVKNSDYTDATAFTNSLTGAYLVYELATPITLAITSQDIPTLLNENNIFTNTNGNVDVIYHHALTAKNIDFDNTGTALQADNVEDAIKEILTLIQGDNNSRALNLSKGSLKVEAPVSNEEPAIEEDPTTEEAPEAISDSESEPISDE